MPFTTETAPAPVLKPALDPFHEIITARFADACKRAADRSAKEQCTVYVCAVIVRDDFGIPYVHDFSTSDWSDGSVCTSFTYGKEDKE